MIVIKEEIKQLTPFSGFRCGAVDLHLLEKGEPVILTDNYGFCCLKCIEAGRVQLVFQDEESATEKMKKLLEPNLFWLKNRFDGSGSEQEKFKNVRATILNLKIMAYKIGLESNEFPDDKKIMFGDIIIAIKHTLEKEGLKGIGDAQGYVAENFSKRGTIKAIRKIF